MNCYINTHIGSGSKHTQFVCTHVHIHVNSVWGTLLCTWSAKNVLAITSAKQPFKRVQYIQYTEYRFTVEPPIKDTLNKRHNGKNDKDIL